MKYYFPIKRNWLYAQDSVNESQIMKQSIKINQRKHILYDFIYTKFKNKKHFWKGDKRESLWGLTMFCILKGWYLHTQM